MSATSQLRVEPHLDLAHLRVELRLTCAEWHGDAKKPAAIVDAEGRAGAYRVVDGAFAQIK